MKAYVAVQRKLLILIYSLWKKNEAFNPALQATAQEIFRNEEMEPSFAGSEEPKKTAPNNGAVLDRHSSTYQCLPSFAMQK